MATIEAPALDAPFAPDVERRVQELLSRPYRMVVQGDSGEGYLAFVPELPGCMTAGDTPEEAMALLRDAMRGWFGTRLEQGLEIADPLPPAEPVKAWKQSGRFLFRMPKSVHQELLDRAEAEGVSVNHLLLSYVSRGLGGAAEIAIKSRP